MVCHWAKIRSQGGHANTICGTKVGKQNGGAKPHGGQKVSGITRAGNYIVQSTTSDEELFIHKGTHEEFVARMRQHRASLGDWSKLGISAHVEYDAWAHNAEALPPATFHTMDLAKIEMRVLAHTLGFVPAWLIRLGLLPKKILFKTLYSGTAPWWLKHIRLLAAGVLVFPWTLLFALVYWLRHR